MDKKILDSLLIDTGQDRVDHTLRVVEESKKLAYVHSVDIDKATQAAFLHDCAKFKDGKNLLKMAVDFDIILSDIMRASLDLIHAPLGAKIAEHKYNIKDSDILNAIKYHTTGRKDMTKLEKIIYIADYIEPYRKFHGVKEVRQLAYVDLDKSLLLAMNQTIIFLIEKNRLISPDTIEARNQFINN
ncbi:MAG: HD domain-containing protein [Tissierella sp.]|nr:HD domain-containing protein [Tissierella sp.]